jgi:hypothetical protein
MSEIEKGGQSNGGNVVPDPFRTMHVNQALKGTQAMMSLSRGREIA